MNVIRAKEIKDDPVMQDVYYNGKPVYINDVNEDTQQATVRYTKESEDFFVVDVTELIEQR